MGAGKAAADVSNVNFPFWLACQGHGSCAVSTEIIAVAPSSGGAASGSRSTPFLKLKSKWEKGRREKRGGGPIIRFVDGGSLIIAVGETSDPV